MELSRAVIIANDITNVLSPYCKRIAIAEAYGRETSCCQGYRPGGSSLDQGNSFISL
jgi:hypothetical protein